MALVLVALFLVLPFAELAVIVGAADAVGLGWTFVALVAFSVLGGWLVRREGSAIWRRANEELAAGRMPTRQVLDGALVLLGGALLLTPGFITDAVGLLLLFSPTRALLRPLVLRMMERRAVWPVHVDVAPGTQPFAGRGAQGPVHEATARERPGGTARERPGGTARERPGGTARERPGGTARERSGDGDGGDRGLGR